MIENITKNKRTGIEIEFADSFLKRALGLMGRKLDKNQALVFKFPELEKNNIHTYFMRQKIDLIVMNDHRSVVHMVRNLGKWSIIKPDEEYRYLIEGNPGLINRLDIEKADILNWSQ